MKKIILLLAFLSTLQFNAQNKVVKQVEDLIARRAVFQHFSVMTQVNSFQNKEYEKAVSDATLGTINFASVNEIVEKKYQTIEVEIPYHEQILTVQLFKADIYAEGFHLDTDKDTNLNYTSGVFYRGIIKGEHNSLVSFSFFNNAMQGTISSSKLSNIVVAKLNKPGNISDYIVYADENLKMVPNLDCHADDNHVIGDLGSHRDGNQTQSTMSAKCVNMYVEIDHDLYTANGSTENQTLNWISSVFNNVQTLYSNDGISVALKNVFIWTNSDPYTGNSSDDYLTLFGQVRSNFDGDVGQLVGIDPGGLGGVAASIGGICSDFNYSYADVDFDFDTVPTYSWTIQVMTHETGHVLGSRHTHACVWNGNDTCIDGCAGYAEGGCPIGSIPSASAKGTIMSYCHLVSGVGISFNNGFGPQPAQAVINNVNGSGCLSSNCLGGCINNVGNIHITSVDLAAGTATINWADSNITTQWEISVTPVDSEFEFPDVANSTSYEAMFLTVGTTYRVKIRPICSQNLTTSYAELTFVFENLGIDDNSKINFSYYPNPTKDYVTVSAKSQIDNIDVYNIEGRLLLHKKINATETKIDISSFAAGTYFFKLKSGDQQANFKVLKM